LVERTASLHVWRSNQSRLLRSDVESQEFLQLVRELYIILLIYSLIRKDVIEGLPEVMATDGSHVPAAEARCDETGLASTGSLLTPDSRVTCSRHFERHTHATRLTSRLSDSLPRLVFDRCLNADLLAQCAVGHMNLSQSKSWLS
jgi:hypothetical protein